MLVHFIVSPLPTKTTLLGFGGDSMISVGAGHWPARYKIRTAQRRSLF